MFMFLNPFLLSILQSHNKSQWPNSGSQKSQKRNLAATIANSRARKETALENLPSAWGVPQRGEELPPGRDRTIPALWSKMRWGRTEIEILHHLPFKWATPTLAQATEVLWKPAMRCATWISSWERTWHLDARTAVSWHIQLLMPPGSQGSTWLHTWRHILSRQPPAVTATARGLGTGHLFPTWDSFNR